MYNHGGHVTSRRCSVQDGPSAQFDWCRPHDVTLHAALAPVKARKVDAEAEAPIAPAAERPQAALVVNDGLGDQSGNEDGDGAAIAPQPLRAPPDGATP